MTVLLVEDNPDVQEAFSLGLQMNGFNVVSVDRGKKAIEMVSDLQPDVMIMDYHLPDSNGIELALSLEGPEKPKLVLLTGVDEPELHQKAIQAGFDAFFKKPVKIKDLAQWIQTNG
ncbi:MAG: response regulator [Planctomycetota bacterium]